MSIVASSARPVTRIIFNACEPRPVNRVFGAGLLPSRTLRTVGYTASDARWFAEQTRDNATPTEAEERDRRNMLTMSAREYRDLCMELEQMERDSYDRWCEAMAEEQAEMDRMESLPVQYKHHAIGGEAGEPVALILDGVDASDLTHAASRAQLVCDSRGSSLRHTCFVARGHDGKTFMMDRDLAADRVRFTGSMSIRPAALCAAFGVSKLPG